MLIFLYLEITLFIDFSKKMKTKFHGLSEIEFCGTIRTGAGLVHKSELLEPLCVLSLNRVRRNVGFSGEILCQRPNYWFFQEPKMRVANGMIAGALVKWTPDPVEPFRVSQTFLRKY